MDLPNFQLDTINDIDMLRSLTYSQPANIHQDACFQDRPHERSTGILDGLSGNDNIGMLMQVPSTFDFPGDMERLMTSLRQTLSSSTNNIQHHNKIMTSSSYIPTSTSAQVHGQSTPVPNNPHHDYFDEDILTPLISPAMTPSFSYQTQPPPQKQQQQPMMNMASDVDFSPLSSPAIMPQYGHHPNRSRDLSSNSTYSDIQMEENLDQMTPSQICEQYEKLEQAKVLISRRLSELQRQQKMSASGNTIRRLNDNDNRGFVSSEGQPSPSSVQHADMMHTMAIPSSTSGVSNPVNAAPMSPAGSPYIEPVTPSSLMNIRQQQQQQQQRMDHPRPRHISIPTSGQPFEHDNNNQQHQNSSPVLNNQQDGQTSPPVSDTPSPPNARRGGGGRMRTSPRSTGGKSAPLSRSKSSTPQKKGRRESHEITKSVSPRALKPLLISPTMRPGMPSPSIHDAERILATRSNYQNLMEGKAAALGIAFSPNIKSGIEIRRTAHKAAEQKRRDSLKEWFDRLRREVEDNYVKKKATSSKKNQQQQENGMETDSKDGNNNDEDEEEVETSNGKPLSKVLLLRYAYEYISQLKETIAEKDKQIESLEQTFATQ